MTMLPIRHLRFPLPNGLFLLAGLLCLAAACGDSAADRPLPARPAPLQEEPFDDLIHLFEHKERDNWQNPDAILAQLGDLEGLTVADLGAGSGYFSFRLLPLASKVIALEIDDRFIQYLETRRSRLPDSLAAKLDIRLTPADSTRLLDEEADVVLIVNTYIYMRDRVAYLRQLREKLGPEGKLVIVDFRNSPTQHGPPLELRLPPEFVRRELLEAGFVAVEIDQQTLRQQYIVRATAG